MSNTIYSVMSDASFTADNAEFDVSNGAYLNLSGSSDTVIMQSDSIGLTFMGNDSTILGSNFRGANVFVRGSGKNTIDLGDNTSLIDWSEGGDIITIGSNSSIEAGAYATIYANKGGDNISTGDNDFVYGTNNTINLLYGQTTLNGSGNQIHMDRDGLALVLNGSNNSISMQQGVVTTTTASLSDDAAGIVASGSVDLASVTLVGGIATVKLGDGNVAQINHVTSGTTLEYTDLYGNKTTSSLTDSNLSHIYGSLYLVTGDVLAKLSNSTLDVVSGASLDLQGNSDTVVLEAGAKANISGNGVTVVGSTVSGASVWMSGSGNVIQLGDNSYVMDWGSDGETITVGANSQVNANSNVTINATHGGDTVVAYWNSTINANNDDISVVTGSVNGNNNTIQSNYGNASLNLIGSNNSVNLTYSNNIVNLDGHNNTVFFNADDTSQLITTENGDYVEERADGSIWSSSASVNIKGGVVTLGFGDGNKVVISGSKSGLLTDTQVNQLVSAMASYTTGSDGVSSSSTAQAPVDLSQLFASSHH